MNRISGRLQSAVSRLSWVALIGFCACLKILPQDGHEPPPPDDGPMHHSFADVEQFARIFESPERGTWQKPDKVIQALQLLPGMHVADIGSGTGYFARLLAPAVRPGGSVFASDLEPGMVEYVRDRAEKEKMPNIVPVLASADDPRLPDGISDRIFICDTWHHIQDRIGYARRLREDLSEIGWVVIVDYMPGDLPVGPPAGQGKLSADQVIAEFAEAGYSLANRENFLPYQYFLVFEPKRQ